jgi:tRNA G10  N-methylase Trm11
MTYQLILGDCLEYMRTMTAGSVDAVITDPPYGMNLDTDYSGIDNGIIHAPIIGDDRKFDPMPFLPIASRHIFWGAQYFCHSLPESGGWLVFNKRGYGAPSEICFGDCELAW